MSPQCQRVVCWSREGCHCKTRPGFRWGRQGRTCWHVRRRSPRLMSHCSAADAAGLHTLRSQRWTLYLKPLYIICISCTQTVVGMLLIIVVYYTLLATFFFKWDKKKKRHIWSAHYADNWLTIATVTHYNIALQVKCKNTQTNVLCQLTPGCACMWRPCI